MGVEKDISLRVPSKGFLLKIRAVQFALNENCFIGKKGFFFFKELLALHLSQTFLEIFLNLIGKKP